MTHADLTTESPYNPILRGGSPPPLMLVLSGPSGVGKDSVVQALKARGLPFHFVVTMTTRPPREGEVDGRDYHFVSKETFSRLLEEGELLEWAQVYGNYYGVPRSQVREALQRGQDVIMRVDVQGASTLKQLAPEAIFVFLAPPSLETLARRLRARGKDSEAEITLRLKTAEREMEAVGIFDYVVINRDGALEETVDRILAILQAEKHRVIPRRVTI